MSEIAKISESEWEVMKIIWKSNPTTSEEVIDQLSDHKDWTAQTIKTFLNRLVNKGALGFEKSGRIYKYYPILQEKDFVKTESKSFLKRIYNGALGMLVSNLLEEEELTDKELEELERLILSKKREKK
ncbi:BlaI/MecI/CopY family transcriptional regulator [Acetivibrio cellulolyticus]|uniref:BlaI/MecI/CopY family transcriptional regulator n=1 Tax=Acetivibrio cellulolyticus TaxID=35830 RepID=UPI0001E2F0CC|nr:BlaI/MecI/CopY family transcriptional regulator [Acetivibrio cellulolyticus]